jgi:hypothetical protein
MDVLALLEPQPGLLHVWPVATLAPPGDKRLHLLLESTFGLPGGKAFRRKQRREDGRERKRGTHGSTVQSN